MRRTNWILILSLAASHCGSPPSTTDRLDTLVLAAPPKNGIQVVLPIVHDVMPGQSYEYCTWTDQVLDHDLEVKSAQAFQSPTGHHVLIYYTADQQPPGTRRICTERDMVSLRFAVGSGESKVVEAPGNLVYFIPKGSQIVVNEHFLNATQKKVDAQSAFNLTYVDPGSIVVRSSPIVFDDTSMVVAPGAATLDINCTMPRSVQLWQFLPHMHQWGSYIRIDRIHQGATTRLFDVTWAPELVFNPPQMTIDPNNAYVLEKGDNIQVHCEWMNDTSQPMTFGSEMCVGFGQTINAEGLSSIQCNGGVWGPL